MCKVVIVKKTGKVYPVEAYGNNCFYVKDGEPYTGDYLKVGLNGNLTKMTALEMELVLFATKEPSWNNEQMIWDPTGKLEYLGSTYEQRRRMQTTVL